MRDDVREAINEALETLTDTPFMSDFDPARASVGRKSRGVFMLRLRRLLENLPSDISIEDLRDEIAAD